MAHNSFESPDTQFCGIAVEDIKNPFNIGGIVRACGCFDASFAVFQGLRWKEHKGDWRNMDVMQRRKEMPVFLGVESVCSYVPYDVQMVAVERSDEATNLFDFEHPRRAMYVLGGEDTSVSPDLLDKCQHKVYVDSDSLNIASCAYILLYDRKMKARAWKANQIACPYCESYFNKVIDDDMLHCITCGNDFPNKILKED